MEATFAAGCFWHVEDTFTKLPGVLKVEVGYIGGDLENPSYEQVCSGKTGHAEAVSLEFDPKRISYEKLLKIFWASHDPTSLNRQGLDIGKQYRSAIFYHTPEQKTQAENSKEQLAKSGTLSRSIKTEITPAGHFYRAEEYHQRYFEKHRIKGCEI